MSSALYQSLLTMPAYHNAGFFAWLLRATWQASVLIALVLLVQWLFRRQLSPRWRYSLWLLVVVRLALPFSAQSGLSVFNFIKARHILEPLGPVTTVAAESNSSSSGASSSSGSGPIPAARYMNGNKVPAVSGPASMAAAMPVSGWKSFVRDWWFPLAVCCWLAGAVSLPLQLFLSTFRLARRIRCQRSMIDPAVLGLLEDCKELMHVRVPLVVIETSEVASPALYGFVRPRLLLPKGLVEKFTTQELRYVFLHELAHIKRHDIAMNWVLTALQVLHWFNPLVWLAFHRMRADRELACDALALSYAHDSETTPYGHTIIKLLEDFARPAAAPSLLGILEDKAQMQQRIGMIARFRRNNRWSMLAAGLATVLAVFCLTDARNAANGAVESAVRNSPRLPFPAAQPNASTFISSIPGMNIVVINASSGNPIPGAVLNADFHLIKERRWLHVTDLIVDSNGLRHLDFPSNSYDSFFLYANAAHHVPRLVNWGWDGSVPPRAYTFRLNEGVRIGGQVVDEEGEPIAGVKVVVRGPSFEQANVGSESYGYQNEVNWVTTDSSGKWSFDEVPAEFGEFRLILEHPDFAKTIFSTDRNTRADGYVPKIAMNALWAREATMVMQRGRTVTGLVVNENNDPIPNAIVRRGALNTESDASGHFHFDHVVPGMMGLNIVADGYTEAIAKFRILDKIPPIVVRLEKAAVISGQVVDFNGAPVPNASVLLGKNRFQADDNLRLTDQNGRFTFSHLPRNTAQATLTVEADGYSPEFAEVPLGGDGKQLRFALKHGHLLRGLVVDADGRPIVNADVSILSWRDHQTLLWHERTDASGRFRWTSAPADEMQGLIGRDFAGSGHEQSLMAFPFKAGSGEQTFTLLQGAMQNNAER